MDIAGVDVTWLGHATLRLRLDDGTTLLVDPWLEGNPTCPASEYEQTGVDAIYVTHGHFDHVLGVESVARSNDAAVFAIHEVAEHFTARGLENVTGSNKGGRVAGPNGISGISWMPCIRRGSREMAASKRVVRPAAGSSIYPEVPPSTSQATPRSSAIWR